MALLPVTLRRRLRSSGFSEQQTDVLDEASEATAEAVRDGMASQTEVKSGFAALRDEIRALRADMHTLVWQVFGAVAALILAATGAIIAAIAAWG